MAAQTPRFGLNYYGGDTPGALSDDGQKFTSEDRLALDRLLAALESHTHRPSESLTAPAAALTTSSSATGGGLTAGTTYYYVVSFVDELGLETITGPEVAQALPDLLDVPDAPAAVAGTTTGATLGRGEYYYALTALRGDEESVLSDPVSVTVLSTDNRVTLTLPAYGDAEEFQVWRMKDTDSGWTRIDTTTLGTFTDDGSVPSGAYGDPANIPPSSNAGASTYSITVDLTGADVTNVQNAAAWRIYRSTASGSYGAQSLVHVVVERVDDLDPESNLLTSWIDDGDALLPGSPKLHSTQLSIPAYTFESADPLPAATGYPDNYPIVGPGGVLYIKRSGAWSAVGGDASVVSMRGVGTFTGAGAAPTPPPADALNGDLWFNTTTSTWSVLAVSNDAFAKAHLVDTSAGTFTSAAVDNTTFTMETGEPDNDVFKSAWWKYQPKASASATIDTELSTAIGGGSIDTVLHLYSGPANGATFASLTYIHMDDEGGTGATSRMIRDVVAGTTYYIRASSYEDEGINIVLRVAGPTT